MKNQKKWELLKYAYDNYSKGTKFKSLTRESIHTSSGIFFFDEDDKLRDTENSIVHSQLGWAEIITEQPKKIAVQVNNEKEFSTLMKYYDSLGYAWNGGDKPLAKQELHCYPNAIKFEDRFQHSIGMECPDYTIIPFDNFAKEHNIKLPLIKSEDGIWLYEGDYYACIKNLHGKGYKFCFDSKPLEPSHFVITDSSICKAFSTKEAALKWIEEQKPKTIKIECNDNYVAVVNKDFVEWAGILPHRITKETVTNLYEAFKKLS